MIEGSCREWGIGKGSFLGNYLDGDSKGRCYRVRFFSK